MNAAEVVTVQHLIKRYGNLLVVNDVSFSIREGEIFGIIGPNGAGKTTSVECISGLHAPDADQSACTGFLRRRTETRSESWSVSSCRRVPCLHGSGWERQ